MPQRIVSMHAAYKSGKEVVDGFLSRLLIHKPTPALVLFCGYRTSMTRRGPLPENMPMRGSFVSRRISSMEQFPVIPPSRLISKPL